MKRVFESRCPECGRPCKVTLVDNRAEVLENVTEVKFFCVDHGAWDIQLNKLAA